MKFNFQVNSKFAAVNTCTWTLQCSALKTAFLFPRMYMENVLTFSHDTKSDSGCHGNEDEDGQDDNDDDGAWDPRWRGLPGST